MRRREWVGTGSPPLSEALKKGIKLGLDLRGGIHLVLQVNTADAVKAERDDAVGLAPDAGPRAGSSMLGAGRDPLRRPPSRSPSRRKRTTKKLDEIVSAGWPTWNVAVGRGQVELQR